MFSNRLKNLRLTNELSQKALALKIDLSANIICEYEKGRSQPNIDTLIKLSNIFNCSVDYLIGNEDDFGVISSSSENGLTYEENRIIQIYRTLSDRDKKMIDNIFNSFVSDVPQKNVHA